MQKFFLRTTANGLAAAVLSFTLAGCIFGPAPVTPVAPAPQAEIALLSKGQKAYLDMDRPARKKAFADVQFRKKMGKLGYYPLPVEFRWECSASQPVEFLLELSENENCSYAQQVRTKATSAKIDNLKIAQTYYWRVTAIDPTGGKSISPVSTFRTEDHAPRLMRIPGVPNVRDLGGRIGLNGRRVKQGLVYRTAGLNDNARKTAMTETEMRAALGSEDRIANWEASRAAIRQALEQKEELNALPYLLKPEWTVIFTGENEAAAKQVHAFRCIADVQKAFPKARCEVRPIAPDGKVDLSFLGTVDDHRTALVMQEFDSPSDGWMLVNCGADWFWQLNANTLLAAYHLTGNELTVAADNYLVPVPVKKGRNFLCATVGSGSAGWCFCIVQPAKAPKLRTALKKALKQVSSSASKMVPGRNRLDEATRKYLTKTLGVRSDIDLRSDNECYGMTGSPMGPGVTWFHYSSSAYGGMQSKSGKAAFTKVFRVFLDRANYPVIFHCIAGQDRTGAVAFILNGLLGVAEEELYRDWEATGFWNRSAGFNHRKLFDKLVEGFQQFPGKTLNDKIEAYVLSLGFTKADIAQFRSIMLED